MEDYTFDTVSNSKICYVLMPFSSTISTKNWDVVYQRLFKPVIEESKFGYTCERSEIRNGSFTKDIVQNLKTAYLVLADITDFNSNVMWELGVRHALSQRTVMVAREDMIEKIPADIKGYGVLAYPNDITGFTKFKEELFVVLEKIENDPERSDNPVFDFLKIEDLILTSIEKKQIIGKLTSLLSELFDNLNYIEKYILKTPEVGTLGRVHRLPTHAINELLSTAYVPINQSFHVKLKIVQQGLHNANKLEDQVFYESGYTENAIKGIADGYVEIKSYILEVIQISKNIFNAIKTNKFDFTESEVFILSEEHKKLLDVK